MKQGNTISATLFNLVLEKIMKKTELDKNIITDDKKQWQTRDKN